MNLETPLMIRTLQRKLYCKAKVELILASLLAASPAIAQHYEPPTYLPPVTVVYAPPPPNPVAAIIMLPFAILGGIANAFQPSYAERATAYDAVVPDGQGGWVPITNSRIMPDGSLRPFDPVLDLPPPPQPASEPKYYQPAPLPAPPRRHHALHHEPKSSGGCYDNSGKFVGQDNSDCVSQ